MPDWACLLTILLTSLPTGGAIGLWFVRYERQRIRHWQVKEDEQMRLWMAREQEQWQRWRACWAALTYMPEDDDTPCEP